MYYGESNKLNQAAGPWRPPDVRLTPALIIVLGSVFLMYPRAGAQVTTATILGTVRDPSAAPVPGALVVAANEATGLKYTSTAGPEGCQ